MEDIIVWLGLRNDALRLCYYIQEISTSIEYLLTACAIVACSSLTFTLIFLHCAECLLHIRLVYNILVCYIPRL